MDRVLLWGWYGFENIGDDLLLKTALEHLHGEITVPMKSMYTLPGVKQVPRSYKKLLFGAFHQDAVVIGPGGLFPFDQKSKVLLYYMATGLWRLMRRRVAFFGIGISEKMSRFSAFLWRRMARRADLFLPRSEKVLERLGLTETNKIHAMADCVFASDTIQGTAPIDSNIVAVSVANFRSGDQSAVQDAVTKWVDVVKMLLAKGYRVDLIAFSKGSDDEMVDAIAASPQLVGMGKIRPIHYSDITNVVIDNWSQYKFAICMRFHSLVLSVLNGVPALPIAYGHKTFALAKKCGLADYTLVWNTYQSEYFGQCLDISSNQICEKADQLCAHLDDVHKELLERRKVLIDSATAAFAQLNAVLYEKR